ncbi:MAG: ABC transporter ATP-binding protein [Flavobacteriales bacterium]|nr:MAG: ABC transporter ATP-binding protein [Flavobacteriales bacterium]
MNNILEIDSVILEYNGRKILQDVYLKSETGNITGLLGRNGSGKTSLMNIIYGNIFISNSSIRIDKKTLPRTYRQPEKIRYLPQFSYTPKGLTIKKIFKDYKLDFSDFTTIFPDLERYYNSKISTLSGGEIRIIEIYSILASKTLFCMLDEPFSQVMPIHIESIKTLISREKINKGIVLSDHLYEHILDICDDLYVINNGKVHLTSEHKDIEKLGYAKINSY